MNYNDFTFITEGNAFLPEAGGQCVEQRERRALARHAINDEERDLYRAWHTMRKAWRAIQKNPELREPVVNFLIASCGGE